MSEAGTTAEVRPLAPRAAAAGGGGRRLLQSVRRTPVAVIGAAAVGLVVLVALAAPLLAPHDPVAQIAKPLLPPGPEYLAGTDEFGRDELSRLIWGARVSLYVGGLAVLIALGLGASSGVLAGYFGGWVDDVTMRIMDVLLSMPALVLAIAITAVLGPSRPFLVMRPGVVTHLEVLARPHPLGGVLHRDAGAPDRGKQALGRLDGAMRKDSATVRILRVEIDRRARAAAIDQVVEVDGQKSDRRADTRLARVGRIELHVVGGDDVPPAMILERFFRRHGCLRSRSDVRRLRTGFRPYLTLWSLQNQHS